MKKELHIKLYNFVAKTLWEDWDPIGINDHGPKDEYNGYVPEIFRMLERKEEQHQIAKRLNEFATISMGLSNGNMQHSLEVAAKLTEGFNDLKNAT